MQIEVNNDVGKAAVCEGKLLSKKFGRRMGGGWRIEHIGAGLEEVAAMQSHGRGAWHTNGE